MERFFGKNKDNYKNAVRTKSFQVLSFLNSLKVHFLLNHQVYFSEILGALSEEEGERFHQDGKKISRKFECAREQLQTLFIRSNKRSLFSEETTYLSRFRGSFY